MLITKEFTFESAHFLPGYAGKCKDMHGHSYRLHVTLSGKVDPKSGMVMDFHDIRTIVSKRILDKLDHKLLNDTIPNPTAENIVMWIWKELKKEGKSFPLFELRLWETEKSFVTYRGD